MQSFSKEKCCQFWRDNDIGFFHSEPSNGVVWHNNFFQCINHIINKWFTIFIRVFKENNILVVIVNVYSSCNLQEKTQIWDELKAIRLREACNSWCILGDFNSIRKDGERKGVNCGRSNKREMQGFNNFIDSMEVVDIPNIGRKYMWYKPNGKAKSRHDRFLTCFEWLQHWPGCKQYVLNRNISDHCALILKSKVVDWGPKSFRFLDMWHEDKDFDSFIKKKWESYKVQGNNFQMIMDKLKRLKSDLKGWNKKVFGDTQKLKLELTNRIHELDSLDNVDNLEDNKIMERRELLSQLQVNNMRNESLSQQKSRVLWFKQGDSNSKYFHASIKWRRIRNEIKGTHSTISGSWEEDPIIVKEIVNEFYKRKMSAHEDIGVRLDNVEFKL